MQKQKVPLGPDGKRDDGKPDVADLLAKSERAREILEQAKEAQRQEEEEENRAKLRRERQAREQRNRMCCGGWCCGG
jgi:hypothetical protein